jgi:hypothetical protein
VRIPSAPCIPKALIAGGIGVNIPLIGRLDRGRLPLGGGKVIQAAIFADQEETVRVIAVLSDNRKAIGHRN